MVLKFVRPWSPALSSFHSLYSLSLNNLNCAQGLAPKLPFQHRSHRVFQIGNCSPESSCGCLRGALNLMWQDWAQPLPASRPGPLWCFLCSSAAPLSSQESCFHDSDSPQSANYPNKMFPLIRPFFIAGIVYVCAPVSMCFTFSCRWPLSSTGLG